MTRPAVIHLICADRSRKVRRVLGKELGKACHRTFTGPTSKGCT